MEQQEECHTVQVKVQHQPKQHHKWKRSTDEVDMEAEDEEALKEDGTEESANAEGGEVVAVTDGAVRKERSLGHLALGLGALGAANLAGAVAGAHVGKKLGLGVGLLLGKKKAAQRKVQAKKVVQKAVHHKVKHETVCNQVPVKRCTSSQQCEKVPWQKCEKLPVKNCKQVPNTKCWSTPHEVSLLTSHQTSIRNQDAQGEDLLSCF